MRYFSYIVECSNGSLYAGWTNDLEKRLSQHNEGKGAKYTRALRPVVLRASWEFPSKSEAMSHEWQIKQLSRPGKLKLIESGFTEENDQKKRTTQIEQSPSLSSRKTD